MFYSKHDGITTIKLALKSVVFSFGYLVVRCNSKRSSFSLPRSEGCGCKKYSLELGHVMANIENNKSNIFICILKH